MAYMSGKPRRMATRFRWTGEYASLFVPGDARVARIPMRLPAAARAVIPIGVEVMAGASREGAS